MTTMTEEEIKIADIRICLDFDGVVHIMKNWNGNGVDILDPPVPGAFDFIDNLLDAGYVVAIFSCRSKFEEAIVAMKEWFVKFGYERVKELEFPAYKPASLLYIDDRGWQFRGTFPDVEYLANFKTWVQCEQ